MKKSYVPVAAFVTLALLGTAFSKGGLKAYSAPIKEAPKHSEQSVAVPGDLRYVFVDQTEWALLHG